MTRTLACTAIALCAFAANSLFCRLALRGQAIDPASFSAIRIVAGAAALTALVLARDRRLPWAGTTWVSAGLLTLYAIPFSFAYLHLTAGTGALLLFAAVQLTMIVVSMARGESPRAAQWAGLVCASAGLVYLVLPGVTAPAPLSAALMVLAGVAWGLYSLRGRGSTDPLGQTAGNFVRSVPFALAACLIAWPKQAPRWDGVVWAILSGAVASGLGYAVWYTALRRLSAVTAAVSQLAVPILAALGGVLLLDETLTSRLIVAALFVLGGIAMTVPRPRG